MRATSAERKGDARESQASCAFVPQVGKASLCALVLAVCLSHAGCLFVPGQRYHHFRTTTPLRETDVLILGFLGGRDSWDDPTPGVARLARKLREMDLRGVHIEAVENKERELALQLIHNSLDRNESDALEKEELESAKVILYGQSFGGAAVVKVADELKRRDIPVLLTVQVDSVGRDDAEIPQNVSCAANLYQQDGLLIEGEPEIRAADPARTAIIGNFHYEYQDGEIDLSSVPWHKKLFRVAHTKMDRDPKVWSLVEQLILDAARGGCEAVRAARGGAYAGTK